jgi:hypothetical protein
MPAPSGSCTGPAPGGARPRSLPRRELQPGTKTAAPSLAAPDADGGEPAGPSVLVVFVDHAACPWLRLLRRGFRHCFIALRAGPQWLACEPLKDRIELDVLDLPHEFDLARFYGEQGHRVLLGHRPPPAPRRRFALAPLTCVTVIKRLLAMHAPLVWTPSQLYVHLCGPKCGFRPWTQDGVTAGCEPVPRTKSARNLMVDIVPY